MNKLNLYTYIAILFIIVIILSLTVFVIQKKQTTPSVTEPANINQPTPTTIEVRTTTPLTPTEIPATQTGALDEQLPQKEQDLATQKQELKSKVPINNANFFLVFDYGEDKFIVDLKSPEDTNKTVFENWLKSNYPALPLDRFLIK